MNGQEPKPAPHMSTAPAPEAEGQMSLAESTAPKETLPTQEEIPDYTPPPEAKPPTDKRFTVLSSDCPEPKTAEEMRAERVAVVTLYSDLARQTGEERMDVLTTMTGTFKTACLRLVKELDLTHLLT